MNKKAKAFIVATLLVATTITTTACFSGTGPQNTAPTSTPQPTASSKPTQKTSITIASTGDCMSHESNTRAAYSSTNKKFDYTKFFKYVQPYLKAADLTIGNMETNLGEGSTPTDFRGYPAFKTPDAFAEALKWAGFNFLTTANNHILDSRWSGLVRTSDVLDKLDIPHTGTYRTQKERETPAIVDVKGIKTSILAYTYKFEIPAGLNVPTDMKDVAVSFIDIPTIKSEIKKARAAGAELVMVSLHYGPEEYNTQPTAAYKSAVKQVLQAGADGVIGHHPHVLQPIEVLDITRDDGTVVKAPVVYSLGNFICNPSAVSLTAEGMISYLTFERDTTGKITFKEASYMPTYIYKTADNYRVVPVGYAIDNPNQLDGIGNKIESKLRSVWSNAYKLIGDKYAKPLRDVPKYNDLPNQQKTDATY